MITVTQLAVGVQGMTISPDQVWVQVDVGGVPHRLPLGSMQITDAGLVLVGEPLPVQDIVVAPVPGVTVEEDHVHAWDRDMSRERWRCVSGGGCTAVVTFEQLLRYPTPALAADGMNLLDGIADNDMERVLATLTAIADSRGI